METDNLYKLLFELAQDAIVVIEPETMLPVTFNDPILHLLGYTRKEFATLRIADCEVASEEVTAENSLAGILDCGSGDCDTLLRTSKGELKSVRVMVSTMELSGQRYIHLVIREIIRRKEAEKKLKESENRYRAVVEDQTEIICRFKPDGTILFANEVFCRFFGRARDDLIGKRWQPVAFPEDIPVIEGDLCKLAPANPVVVIENRVYSGSGALHWIQFVNRGFFDSEGKLFEIQAVGRDITELKSVQNALDKVMREQEIILENANVGISMIVDRKQLWVNRKMEEFFQYSKEEMVGLTSRMLYPSEEQYDRLGEEAYPLLAQGKPFETVQRLLRRDGSSVWIRYNGRAISPPDMSKGTIWILEDITERKQAEEELRQNRELLHSIIEGISDAIFVKELTGRYIHLNSAACKIVGRSLVEVIGKSDAELFTTAEAKIIMERDQAVITSRESMTFEEALTDCSGNRLDLLSTKGPLFDSNGEVRGIFTIAREVTMIKMAEKVLARANEELEQQVKERTAALQSVNFQLAAEVAERRSIAEELLEQQHKLGAMTLELSLAEERERCRIAAELHDRVGQQLIMGKIRLDALASRLGGDNSDADVDAINKIVAESLNDIRSLTFQLRPPILASAGLEAALQWLAEEMLEDHRLKVEVEKDNLPKPLQYEISSSIFQGVRELLLNVVKHSGVKSARLSILRDADNICITITDNGAGFDIDAAKERKSRTGGFGIFNIQTRVEYLGGSFTIESAPGKGTRGVIIAPLNI